MKLYNFFGKDTSEKIKYEGEGNTPLELYQSLCDNNVISRADGDPYDNFLLKKYNKTWSDFLDKNGDESFDLFEKWKDENNADLTDEEILEMINQEDGNAYFQRIQKWNGKEYEDL